MALQKEFILPSGVSGNYLRASNTYWDVDAREGGCQLNLYHDSSIPRGSDHNILRKCLAKVRITGSVFDSYHNAILDTSLPSNHIAQLYIAAKAGHVVSDWGADCLSDAIDV
jgi:hypothetical protein